MGVFPCESKQTQQMEYAVYHICACLANLTAQFKQSHA